MRFRPSSFVIRISSFEMTLRGRSVITCNPSCASLYQSPHLTGRYRSGQTGQTVNLLALRLRWFESSPAQIFVKMWMPLLEASRRWSTITSAYHDACHGGRTLPWLQTSWAQGIPSSPCAGHLRDDRRIHRRRHSRGHHHRRAVSVPAGGLHLRSMAGLQSFVR